MKHLMKRSLALLMVLMMLISLMSGLTLTAAAAEQSIVDYQTVSVDSTYSSVIKNWGIRGELATFMSPKAEEFYGETSVEDLAALSGSADAATVHTSELYVALQKLMAEAQTKTTSYDATRDLYQYTDSQKNGAETTQISGFYSGALIGPAWDGGQTWNREHTWPDSKGGSGTHENDIMMLRPEAGNVNSSRNNKAYGVSEGFFDPNGESDNKYNVHGDVARIMLYTFVRWGGVTEEGSYTNQVLLNSMWGEAGVMESLDVLLDWAAEDPVDTWELARNDSVQSITGTRNVFVDFPELVFELFEAEVPAGYDTPSGSANETSFTITTNAGEGGEIIVNGEHVAVRPYAGYEVESVAISDGTTYTNEGNYVYTITSTVDCTVTASFYAVDTYTVNVVENGKTVATAQVADGNVFKLPAFSGELPKGYAFRGWVADPVNNVASQPAVIHAPGTELTIDDDYTYYALLTYLNANDQSNAEKSWELVDSAEDLILNDSYIIAGSVTDKALGNVQASNNRPGVAVNKNGNALVFDDSVGVAELILQEGVVEVTEPAESDTYIYTKISSADELVDGDYLIVCEASSVIFDGSLGSLDAANNNQTVTITDETITANEKYQFTITAVDGGYSIKSASGKYIGGTSDANKINTSNTTQYTNTITFNNDESAQIVGSGNPVLRYNSNSGNYRFRYFKSSTYTSQKPIQLYKKTAAVAASATVVAEKATSQKTYAFYDAVNSGYLFASGTGNHLRTQPEIDANASWLITVGADGICTVVAQGENSPNNLLYNQDGMFSCYSSIQEPITLYHGIAGGGTRYYTTSWDSDWEGDIDSTDPTEPPACTHTNTATTTVAATCIKDGSITVTCSDCGEVISTTVIPATGEHTYVDGTCSGCGEAEPTAPSEPAGDEISGRYYIATIRSSGNYFYMTGDLGTASTKRYQAVDSGLTTLPASITEPQTGYVFVLEKNEDGTYSVYAEGVDGNNYLGWSSGNSGMLTSAASAIKATVDAKENGTYNIHFAASDAERYLALNSTAGNNYFAWYKSGQKQDLVLIPVTSGSTEPSEPTEPEVTEPETTVPYVTAPEVGTAYYLVVAQNNSNVNKTLYATGAMSGNYFATTEAEVEAAKVYLETVEGVDGGYRLYFMNGDVKTYMCLYQSTSNTNSGWLKLVTETPAEYYTFNTTFNTLFHAGANNTFYMGCYSTYDTISGSKTSFMTESNVDISQFPARLYPVSTEEVKATAQDGLNKLVDSIKNFYNGCELASTVTVGNVTMNVEWTTKADENAVKIEDGKLILTAQAETVLYSLSATVSNGEDDTASTFWSLSVVPMSDVIVDGSYVIWTADGNAMTTIDSGYGYFAPTKGVALTDGKLSGYVNENLFTFTANGDGTYSIVDNNGNYIYSDMNYSYSKQFTIAATKPALGADWSLIANEDGTYYIYNVDHTGGIGYDTSYGNFGVYTNFVDPEGVRPLPVALNLTPATQIEEVVDPNALTYVFNEYPAGEQYAENELHVLDDVVSVTMNDGHFTQQLRIYDSKSHNSTAIIKSVKDINKIILNAGYKDAKLEVYASTYGQQWVLIDTIDVAVTYADYTVTMPEDTTYGYIKLDAVGDQVRVAEMTVSLGDVIPACEHGEIAEDSAVAATLSQTGLTAGSHCAICGEVIVAQTVVPCLANVEAWNLALGSDLAVNFKLSIDESILDTAFVVITVGENVYEYRVSDSANYLYSVKVAAAQMTETIKVQVVNGEDASVVKEYSVLKYAETVLAGDYAETTKELVKAMLQYGAASQTYFDYNTGSMANATLTEDATNDLSALTNDYVLSGVVEGVRFYGASLLHKDKIGMRYYFQISDINAVSFTVGETSYIAQEKTLTDGTALWYVDIENISIADLSNGIELNAGGISVACSPLAYIVRQYNNSGNEDLVELMQQLYDYHVAAVAYMEANAV